MTGLLLSLLLPAARAGAPTAVLTSSQGVEGSVSLGVAPAELRAKLADPAWVRDVNGGGTTVAVTGRDGACLLADYTSASTLMTVRYSVRQCPTATGYLTSLVKSQDFASYSAEWIVTPEGTGSLLGYRLQVAPSLPLPLSFITGTLRKEVLALMQNFLDHFGPPR